MSYSKNAKMEEGVKLFQDISRGSFE